MSVTNPINLSEGVYTYSVTEDTHTAPSEGSYSAPHIDRNRIKDSGRMLKPLRRIPTNKLGRKYQNKSLI